MEGVTKVTEKGVFVTRMHGHRVALHCHELGTVGVARLAFVAVLEDQQ